MKLICKKICLAAATTVLTSCTNLDEIWYDKVTPDDGWIWETWRGTTMGIALAIDTKLDLEKVDYSRFVMTEADKADHINQLNTLIGYFYLRGLDFFGPFIIFEDTNQPIEGRRRTDLRRWNMYTTEKWWDHQPSDASREVYPVPTNAIAGNNTLAADPID